MQQAVQEKFRQANENLDELNKWLEKVERQIASQDIPIEDIDGLKNQINALKVRKYNPMKKREMSFIVTNGAKFVPEQLNEIWISCKFSLVPYILIVSRC